MIGSVVALACAWNLPQSRGAQSDHAAPRVTTSADPWPAGALVEPQALARIIAGTAVDKPVVYCVGFSFLYQGGHVPGARFAGPASRPQGITALKHQVQDLPRDQPIVLYCGCCPWKKCPNIRPAYRTLQELGFHAVRVLVLLENFRKDWIAQGFPVERDKTAP